jgi:hypothetical protein
MARAAVAGLPVAAYSDRPARPVGRVARRAAAGRIVVQPGREGQFAAVVGAVGWLCVAHLRPVPRFVRVYPPGTRVDAAVAKEAEGAGPGRQETVQERADRNFSDLLQEVRVAQTGVQILFAFLLTLPFSTRFNVTLPRDRVVYVITLLASAAASAFLIAPVSYHRLVFQQGRKPQLVQTASRLAVAGLVCLLIAIVGAVFVVMDVVVDLPAAILAAAAVFLGCATLWYVLPLRHRRLRGD